MNKTKYINFPIKLISGFLVDNRKCLDNILDYICYKDSLEYIPQNRLEGFKEAAAFYGQTDFGNTLERLNNGLRLYDEFHHGSSKAGLNIKIYWDFYKNYKTEFEKVCFIGMLGMKAHIQRDPFKLITYGTWLNRMDGYQKNEKEFPELSREIKDFFKIDEKKGSKPNEYRCKIIKDELKLNWGLEIYGLKMRGFLISFKLDYEKLSYQGMKRNNKYKLNKRKKEEAAARERSRKRLENI
ncbi:hypothetical protein [Yeosuana sp. AK3]